MMLDFLTLNPLDGAWSRGELFVPLAVALMVPTAIRFGVSYFFGQVGDPEAERRPWTWLLSSIALVGIAVWASLNQFESTGFEQPLSPLAVGLHVTALLLAALWCADHVFPDVVPGFKGGLQGTDISASLLIASMLFGSTILSMFGLGILSVPLFLAALVWLVRQGQAGLHLHEPVFERWEKLVATAVGHGEVEKVVGSGRDQSVHYRVSVSAVDWTDKVGGQVDRIVLQVDKPISSVGAVQARAEELADGFDCRIVGFDKLDFQRIKDPEQAAHLRRVRTAVESVTKIVPGVDIVGPEEYVLTEIPDGTDLDRLRARLAGALSMPVALDADWPNNTVSVSRYVDPVGGIFTYEGVGSKLWTPSITPISASWPIGVSAHGGEVELEIASGSHVAISGQTRSGKSVGAYSLLAHLVSMGDRCRIMIVDPNDTTIAPLRRWSLADYTSSNAHPADAIGVMRYLLADQETRKGYLDERMTDKLGPEDFTPDVPMWVFAIDEAANFAAHHDKKAKAEFNGLLQSLSSQSAKFGGRIVLISQKISADTIPTAIRSQLAGKLAYRLGSASEIPMALADSDAVDAEEVLSLKPGQAFLKKVGEIRPTKLRTYFMPDEELDGREVGGHWAVMSRLADAGFGDRTPPAGLLEYVQAAREEFGVGSESTPVAPAAGPAEKPEVLSVDDDMLDDIFGGDE